jgi:hypothetical protein
MTKSHQHEALIEGIEDHKLYYYGAHLYRSPGRRQKKSLGNSQELGQAPFLVLVDVCDSSSIVKSLSQLTRSQKIRFNLAFRYHRLKHNVSESPATVKWVGGLLGFFILGQVYQAFAPDILGPVLDACKDFHVYKKLTNSSNPTAVAPLAIPEREGPNEISNSRKWRVKTPKSVQRSIGTTLVAYYLPKILLRIDGRFEALFAKTEPRFVSTGTQCDDYDNLL